MKISILLTIAALIVAVAADPTPAEDQVASDPLIYSELSPYLESNSILEKRAEEVVAAAALIFNEPAPFADEASDLEANSLEKRAVTCPRGYGLCPKTSNKCCPLGGFCCKKGCCGAGSWCHAGGCCRNNQWGCRGGGCCNKGYNCWISAKGKKGCCPVGKRCA